MWGTLRGLGLLLALSLGALAAASACSSGSSSGGAAACADGRQSCVQADDCPALSCSCQGIRFPVTIRKCAGGCCPTSCAEACPSGGGGTGGASGAGGAPPSSDGQNLEVDWLEVAGSDAIERVERVAVHSDGSVAALVEKPQGGQTTFNRGTSQAVTLSGRAIVTRYKADGSLEWGVPLSAAQNLFAGSIAFLPDGGVVAAGSFKHGGSTQPYEFHVGQGADQQTFSFPRPADNLFLPYVVAFDKAGVLLWVKVDGSGVLLTDATRVVAAGPTLTVYDHAGAVQSQRTLVQTGLAHQSSVDSAAWLPGGGIMAAGRYRADATFEPGTANEQFVSLQGESDAFVARYGNDGSLTRLELFPESGKNEREVVGIGPQADGSAFFVSRTRDSGNKLTSYVERLDQTDQVTWTRTFDRASSVWAAGFGDSVAYVGGRVTATADYPTGAAADVTLALPSGGSGGFIAVFGADGKAQSIVLMPNTSVLALASASTGLIAGGDFLDTASFGSGPTAPQHTSLGSTDLFLAKMKLAQ